MPFNPKDFLKLAQDLTNDSNYNYESAFRTSISRAYYAAFLWCRTWLESLGIVFPLTQDAHAMVIRELRAKRRYMPADALKNLRKHGRNMADYDLRITVSKGNVLTWLQMTEYVMNSVP